MKVLIVEVAKHEDRLRGWLSRQEERVEAEAEYAFYNSPMIPPPLTGATTDVTASIRAQLKTAAYHAGELGYKSVITPGMRTPKVPEDFDKLRAAGEL